MARVQFGAIVTGLRGKVGGSVFSNNGSGATYGTKTTATKAGPKKSIIANILAGASRGWRALSNGERVAYNAYAGTQPRTDSLGRTYYLTGFQTWCGLNTAKRVINEPYLTGFVDPTLPNNTINPMSLDDLIFSKTTGIDLQVTVESVNERTQTMVFASRPVSAGKQSVSGAYKLLKYYAQANAGPQITTAEYEALFGSVVKGNTVFFKIVLINQLSGIQSTVTNDYKVTVVD